MSILIGAGISCAKDDLHAIAPSSGYNEIGTEGIMEGASLEFILATTAINLGNGPDLKEYYAQRDFSPIWTQTHERQKLIDILSESWRHGLNSDAYNIEDILALYRHGDDFQADIMLSDAVASYGRDLTGMRIKPETINQYAQYWKMPASALRILDFVASSDDRVDALRSLEPRGDLYKRLQEELVRLIKGRDSDQGQQFIAIHDILKPHETHKAVPTIRQRMMVDLYSNNNSLYQYDDRLVEAIKAFQKAHGAKPDGIIGPHTVQLMNMGAHDKIRQIIVNMERLRWLDVQSQDRYVIVNIPTSTLWAIDGGQIALEMPVIIGRPKRPTNSFSTTITGIRFNPTWTVPSTIKKEDYLPALQKDPFYLLDRGIEIYQDEMSIDPDAIDWASIDASTVSSFQMVQMPGGGNPLGRVRVLMGNPFDIYLHDTPKKGYFSRDNRALSSGCIRMSKPFEFADFILQDNQGWSGERREELLSKEQQIDIAAQRRVPVYLTYQTMWLGDDGQLIYGRDVYNRDWLLFSALKAVDAIPSFDNKEEDIWNATRSNINKTAMMQKISMEKLD